MNVDSYLRTTMITISMHQSEYLPWPPYFKKIASSDIFVLMDSVQYQKNGVQNRNKIRNKQGAFWITIPVSANLGNSISQARIADPKWGEVHWKSIQACYGRAPFWKLYREGLEKLYKQPYANLADVNAHFLFFILQCLNVPTKIIRLSELNAAGSKSGLVLEVCRLLRADVYVCGLGGKTYLREDDFLQEGIRVNFLESTAPRYPQFHGEFISGLSMIDMMYNLDPEEIRDYLRPDHRLPSG